MTVRFMWAGKYSMMLDNKGLFKLADLINIGMPLRVKVQLHGTEFTDET